MIVFLLVIAVLCFAFIVFDSRVQIMLVTPVPFGRSPEYPLPAEFLFILALYKCIFVPEVLCGKVVI